MRGSVPIAPPPGTGYGWPARLDVPGEAPLPSLAPEPTAGSRPAAGLCWPAFWHTIILGEPGITGIMGEPGITGRLQVDAGSGLCTFPGRPFVMGSATM
jgi:hypothetical protein